MSVGVEMFLHCVDHASLVQIVQPLSPIRIDPVVRGVGHLLVVAHHGIADRRDTEFQACELGMLRLRLLNHFTHCSRIDFNSTCICIRGPVRARLPPVLVAHLVAGDWATAGERPCHSVFLYQPLRLF